MPIFVPDMPQQRGKEDAKRHREKQREVIKENLPGIIADESIITGGTKGKTKKIPIKGLDIPHFRPTRGERSGGIGQGPGAPGDIIGKRPMPGQPGEPGDEPGEDYIETEIDIEELIEMVFEDLGLPLLEEKDAKTIATEMGWTIHGHQKTGPWTLLDRKRTVMEGMRYYMAYMLQLKTDSGRDELTCFSALKEANGSFQGAIAFLKDPAYTAKYPEVVPFPVFETQNLVFHKIVPETSEQSQAVVIAMMDVSGSMTTNKKYLARSMLFWLVAFLRKRYEHVVVRFIVHTTEAKMVEEKQFFETRESGGTFCYSAYELANNLIEEQYPLSQWNVYAWHFSDGDDFDPNKTIAEMRKLVDKGINMLGYGEIKPSEDDSGGWFAEHSQLLRAIIGEFDMSEASNDTFTVVSGDTEPIIGVVIREKEHLLLALQQFLQKDRWVGFGEVI